MNNKPLYKYKKWKLGNSFGWHKIPYCPHCKRQLGTLIGETKNEKCPMCGGELDWEDA